MKHITIRNVPGNVSAVLEKEKRRRGSSLNRTVIDLVSQALGLSPDGRRSNGLASLAGESSERHLREFEAAVSTTEQIDEELWR